MKWIIKFYFLFVLLFILISVETPVFGAKKYSGEILYKKKCGSCHELYKPGSHTAGGWTKHMQHMNSISGTSKKQALLILEYLKENSKDGGNNKKEK
jgi:Dihaem cytochrome c